MEENEVTKKGDENSAFSFLLPQICAAEYLVAIFFVAASHLSVMKMEMHSWFREMACILWLDSSKRNEEVAHSGISC